MEDLSRQSSIKSVNKEYAPQPFTAPQQQQLINQSTDSYKPFKQQLKLDVRDVVRRQNASTELQARRYNPSFQGEFREKQRGDRKKVFMHELTTKPVFTWVNDHGLVVTEAEIEMAYNLWGGEYLMWKYILGKLSEVDLWAKLKTVPNPPSRRELKKMRLFWGEGKTTTWQLLRSLLYNNEVDEFDSVKEAFKLYDKFDDGQVHRDTLKQAMQHWGMGEITEEDVDDALKIIGVDPKEQDCFTLDDYRTLYETDLSHQSGVRVKILTPTEEDENVLFPEPEMGWVERASPSTRPASPPREKRNSSPLPALNGATNHSNSPSPLALSSFSSRANTPQARNTPTGTSNHSPPLRNGKENGNSPQPSPPLRPLNLQPRSAHTSPIRTRPTETPPSNVPRSRSVAAIPTSNSSYSTPNNSYLNNKTARSLSPPLPPRASSVASSTPSKSPFRSSPPLPNNKSSKSTLPSLKLRDINAS